MSDRKPNVVLIVLDSVRPDHLSCYGHSRDTTPHIDRIAAQGIQFMRAYSTSCWTLPSHASLFTGLYPSQHRADFDTKFLDPKHLTLAAYLGRHGYRSASISCNGLVSERLNLTYGFDRSIDVERLRGGSEGLGPKLVRFLHGRWRRWTRRDRGGKRATHLACRWLRECDPTEPFFLFLNYMDCHLPYRLRLPVRYQFVAAADRRRVDTVQQDPFAHMAGRLSYSAQDLVDLQALYDGCLFYLDQQIGRLVDLLQDLGVWEQTAFIVTSDHGESFGEHGLMDHQYGLYEHLLSVPLIMRLPRSQSAGQRRRELTQLVDLFPTIAGLVGNGHPETGLPAWSGPSMLEGPGRSSVLAEYLVPNLRLFRRRFPALDVSRYDVAMRSIRTERYKLIWRSQGPAELYDLEEDPGEANDLAAVRGELVRDLAEKLEHTLGPWAPDGYDSADREFEGDIEERLRALGYL